MRYDEIRPVYLPPADARAAFESGNVDAWVVWDPYYAAAQNALKVRTLSDYTGLAATNNFYEATRDFAQQHPDVVGAILKQARETGQWVNTHPADTAALIAPKVGLPQPIVETWIKRVPFGAVPLDEKIVAAQQRVADAFYAAKLIPQKLNVADNAWVDKTRSVRSRQSSGNPARNLSKRPPGTRLVGLSCSCRIFGKCGTHCRRKRQRASLAFAFIVDAPARHAAQHAPLRRATSLRPQTGRAVKQLQVND